MEWRFSLAFFADGILFGRLFRFALAMATTSLSTNLLGFLLGLLADWIPFSFFTLSLFDSWIAGVFGVFGVFGDFNVFGVVVVFGDFNVFSVVG